MIQSEAKRLRKILSNNFSPSQLRHWNVGTVLAERDVHWGVFSKCLSLIHHNDSYAFETGTRFYTPNVKGVNYKFKTESQYSAEIHFRL